MGREDLKVNPDNPIDSVVGNLIETVARQGRGFTLGLLADEKDSDHLKITVEERLKPKDEWLPPVDYRNHVLTDTGSLVAFAQKYGSVERSVIYVGETGATFVVDEARELGSRETIRLELPLSDDFEEWTGIFGQPRYHKDLLQFLREHEDNLLEPQVLVAMQSIRTTATVNHESSITDDGKQVGMMFRVNGDENLVKFPKQFTIQLPVLQADEGETPKWERALVRLTVELPDSPQGRASFTLWCPELNTIHRRRMSKEAAALRKALDGWLVVEGSYGTRPHELATRNK